MSVSAIFLNRQSELIRYRVWHASKGEVRFVEVKGPGDSLSETQKVSQN